jgi:undecaprenyl-diphosphatase
MSQVVALNEALVRRVYMLRTPVLDAVMLLFTRAGNPWVVAGLLVTLALVLLWLRRWSDIVGVAVAGGGAWFLTETLKHYYQRARPALVPTPLEVSSSSFPSAHALGAMVGYGILLFVGWRVLRRRWLLLVPPGIIMLIGISRVYFGVHFLTDVLAGFLVGLAWLLVSARVVWMIDGSRFDEEL